MKATDMYSKICIVLATCLFICACNTSQPGTLYEQLGGEEGISSIVDNLIRNIAQDPQIFPYFADANVTRFRDMLSLHMCDVSDGPCTYDGDDLVDIHIGMNVTETDFNQLVDLLIDAMNTAGVAHPVQNRLLQRLAPMRSEVIYL